MTDSTIRMHFISIEQNTLLQLMGFLGGGFVQVFLKVFGMVLFKVNFVHILVQYVFRNVVYL